VGIIGFGRIGKAVAQMAKDFGFRVLATDPYVNEVEMQKIGVEALSFDSLLRRTDFVSLHLRLTESTRHLLGKKQFRSMKPSAYLINTSRGGVVDENSLIQALKNDWIAGAALDVLEKEPPDPQNPLLSMDNVLLTGHAAGTSVDGIEDWQEEWRTIIDAVIQRSLPINVVNPDVRPRFTTDV
jgi:D-3-phosphoglycerate dehydrogenase